VFWRIMGYNSKIGITLSLWGIIYIEPILGEKE